MRPIALGGRNWTFTGSDAGGERAAAIYSLIENVDYQETVVRQDAWHPSDSPGNQRLSF